MPRIVCSYGQVSHCSYWGNLLRKEDKFRPISCISFFFFFFTCKEREKEWNYPQVSERRNKVIFFFFLLSSARLIISFFFLSFFFFSSFLFFKSLPALRVSQISLCLDCTGINGYSLYTCNESRLWTDSLIVMIMLRIMLRRYLISCSAILSFL